MEREIKEIRNNLGTLYRNNAIVLSDFDRLMLACMGELQRTESVFNLQTLLTAIDFAALKHVGQVRNHTELVPYFIHPMRVALVLFSEGAVAQDDLLTAALLHDTLEDTRTSAEEIASVFGPRIVVLVEELTQLPGQSMEDHVAKMALEARVIKLADRTHNLRDLIDHPPQVWRNDKVEGFIQRSKELLQMLKGAHPILEQKYLDALIALEKINRA